MEVRECLVCGGSVISHYTISGDIEPKVHSLCIVCPNCNVRFPSTPENGESWK